MERFVKSLNDRLAADGRSTTVLIGIMDGAINEMHNNGIFQKLPADLQKKIHSSDPEERINVKTAVAKDFAVQNFIKSSRPITLQNREVGHRINVKYDPRYLNSIALCIQGGLEGLYLSDAYKRCEDEVMQYYIQTDASGENYRKFHYKMMELEDLYDHFQINFMQVTSDPIASADLKPAPNSKPASDSKQAQTEEKEGFFARLFRKK